MESKGINLCNQYTSNVCVLLLYLMSSNCMNWMRQKWFKFKFNDHYFRFSLINFVQYLIFSSFSKVFLWSIYLTSFKILVYLIFYVLTFKFKVFSYKFLSLTLIASRRVCEIFYIIIVSLINYKVLYYKFFLFGKIFINLIKV